MKTVGRAEIHSGTKRIYGTVLEKEGHSVWKKERTRLSHQAAQAQGNMHKNQRGIILQVFIVSRA